MNHPEATEETEVVGVDEEGGVADLTEATVREAI